MIDKFRSYLQKRRKDSGINFVFCLEHIRYEFDLDKWVQTESADRADAILVTIASKNICISERHVKDEFCEDNIDRMIKVIIARDDIQKLE